MRNRLFVSAIILAFLLETSCFGKAGKDNKGKGYTITYEVSGTAENAEIIYLNPRDNNQKLVRDKLPWNITFSIEPDDVITLSLSAKADGLNFGTITSTIIVNGNVLKVSTSSGPLATAVAREIVKIF